MSEPLPVHSGDRLPVRFDPRRYAGATGLVRFAVGTGWRVSGWAVRSTVATSTELMRDVVSGRPIPEILDRQLDAARRRMVRALGLSPYGPLVVRMEGDSASPAELREQGDALLRHLGDPQLRPREEHPAFARVLRELTPDEARMLRFLTLSGPQPVIDVRTKTPLGKGSELLATGINLVADMAGCTYPDRDQQYLANLVRLGLVLFSEEQVDDPRRYSFVEAQPAAAAAIAKARRTATVYRSVGISEFGRQFCEVCFTLDGYDAGGWLDDVR
ncbi:MAG TPA: Abi-alpha family protein [Sporichthyaceae bacterium]|nr:Abi-alpha family protein [Sporichthyaceae bacterium]